MMEFLAGQFFAALDDARLESDGAFMAREQHGADAKANDQERACLLVVLRKIQQACDSVHLVKVKGRLEPFLNRLATNDGCYYQTIDSEMESLWSVMRSELQERKFAFVSPEKAVFFEQEKLFGDTVYEQFEETRCDIKAAGNSLASDLPDAAVFYTMRVAELGVRRLAADLNVPMPVQIEFSTWGEVLRAIETELGKLKSQKRDAGREEQLQFYSGLLVEIKAFQYLWRDPVSHVRAVYDEHQALSAFKHIRGFMQRLADFISSRLPSPPITTLSAPKQT
jgi:hypothetical protein